MRFVDTNIFIRHLTRDDPEKAQACYQLFLSAQRNEVALTTSEAVIAEVVYVLSSEQLYNLSREQIRALLYPLLTLRGFKLSGREVYLRALDVYASSDLDFEDAIAVARMERHQLSEIYSYDRHFDQMSGLTRLEP